MAAISDEINDAGYYNETLFFVGHLKTPLISEKITPIPLVILSSTHHYQKIRN